MPFEIDFHHCCFKLMLLSPMSAPPQSMQSFPCCCESSTYFIDMCLNETKKGNKPGSHLNKAAWLNIEKGMLEKTGKVFDKKQLSNKWETMKRDWKLYDCLMRLETGIGGTRSLIDASEEWWAEKINANKEFAKFKDINLDIYATHYAPLFQDSVAVGDHTMTPLQFQGGENNEGKGDSDEINLSDDDATRRTNTNGAQERSSTRPTGNEDSLWMTAYRDMIAEEIMNTH
ncbi:hypothetical protein LXL04_021576 [Taraxacum kok-saghyz]